MKKTMSLFLAFVMLCTSLVGFSITGYASTNVREAQLVQIGEEVKLQTTYDKSENYGTPHCWARFKSAKAGAYVFWCSTGSNQNFVIPIIYRSITAAEKVDVDTALESVGMTFDQNDEYRYGYVFHLTADRSYYIDMVAVNRKDEFAEPVITMSIATHTHNYKNYIYSADTDCDGEIGKQCNSCSAQKDVKPIPYVKTIKLSNTSYTYNGKAYKPTVMIKDRTGKTLVAGTDYRITYPRNRVSVGKHTIRIRFIGKYYYGTVKKTYTIRPKGTAITSLSASKRAFTAKWKKQTKKTDGYQLQYSKKSNFEKAETITFSKNTRVSKKVTGLTGGRTYYVRVRTYKTVKGKKVCSKWSKVKKVTPKIF